MTRIHANQKMVGAARSPIRRLNEPEARADPSLRRESAVADRRYQFVAASSLLVWICESVGLRLFLFAARGGFGCSADARFSCPSGECVSPLASGFQRTGDVASRVMDLRQGGVNECCDAYKFEYS
jgi:hypothetical protein